MSSTPPHASSRSGEPKHSSSPPTLVVCGSTNVDTFVSVEQFPSPGETIIGSRGAQGLGGKGANQAAAAAHLGVRTVFCSAVGPSADPLAQLALDALASHGVDTTLTRQVDAPTGQAFIMNDVHGENIIIVTSGANELVAPRDYCDELPADTGVILAQGELTPQHSAQLPELVASRPGVRFVLNLAPVTTTDRALLALADPLVVNEIEAADVTGLPRDTNHEELFEALRHAARSAVVTLGPKGAAIVTQDSVEFVASPPSPRIVDTTGAGDAFCGTLAAALALGEDMITAAQLGCAAGSLATRSRGAASSYATESEIRALSAEYFKAPERLHTS